MIWYLFEREKKNGTWPKHLLCDGFRRSIGPRAHGANTLPGIYAAHHNRHAQSLKEDPWPQLLTLFGKDGGRMMIDLLVDCSIFLSIDAGHNNYYQLSGMYLSPLEEDPC